MFKIALSELCSIQSGGTPSRNIERYWGGDIPWAKISDLEASGDGYISETEEHITNEGLKAIRGRMFDDGTLLFAMYGSVGKTAIVKGVISTNQAILGIQPDKNQLDLKYLKFWLHSQQALFDKDAQGVAQKNLSAGYVRSLEIPLLSLVEQKRIAAILDKADNIRRKRQDAIKLADEFLRAVFLDMFGDPIKNSKSWPTQPLDQVAPSSPSRGVAASKNDHVWLLNLDNIESNTGRILAEYKCSYGEVGSSTHWFDQSHVLYSKLRPYLNKVVLPHTSGIATSELLPLKPNPAVISREYLAFLLRSNPFLHWANNKVAGAKMPRLSTSELRNLLIPIPPIDLQNRFKNIVSQMSALQTKFESSSIESESLFNALSQKAFSGKL